MVLGPPTHVQIADGAKVAVTACVVARVVTEHVDAEPEHSPPQPANIHPLLGVAVSVTMLPAGNPSEHLDPQSMPVGALVMDPPPDLETVSNGTSKIAVTSCGASIRTVHVTDVPPQAPDNPVNSEPAAGLAVRMTDAPDAKPRVEQTGPQSTAAGELVTLPLPEPERLTVNTNGANSAVTLRAALIVTLQIDVAPLQAPLQPVK